MKIRHVVTKSSKDGTFKKGDHIVFEDNGDISCIEARGWIPSKECLEACKGMESTPDVEWLAGKKANLVAQLAELEAL